MFGKARETVKGTERKFTDRGKYVQRLCTPMQVICTAQEQESIPIKNEKPS